MGVNTFQFMCSFGDVVEKKGKTKKEVTGFNYIHQTMVNPLTTFLLLYRTLVLLLLTRQNRPPAILKESLEPKVDEQCTRTNLKYRRFGQYLPPYLSCV